MHLVDDEDNVAHLTDLLDETLHTAFKLAAELCACDERRQIKQVDLLASELEGYLTRHDALGKSFGDGSLADARLTDEAGVVLLAAVEDLDNALDLLRAANDRVELAVARALGKVDAVRIQEFVLAALFGFLIAARALRLLGLAARCVVRSGRAAEKAAQERERSGLAVLVLAVSVGIVGIGQTLQILRAAEGAHHLVGDIVKILIGNAHSAHHLVHLRQSEIFGALEAQALVDVLPVFLTGDEHNGDILFTSGTKLRLHGMSSLGVKIKLTAQQTGCVGYGS